MRRAIILALILLTITGGRLVASPPPDSLLSDTTFASDIPAFLELPAERESINYLRLSLFGASVATGFGITISRMDDWWGNGYGPAHIKENDWDGDNLAQTDEISHFYISYKIAQAGNGFAQWSGLPAGTSRWIGFGIATTIMLWVEYPIDAHNPIQGFGFSDMTANLIGISFALARNKWYDELGFIDFKISVKNFGDINNEVIAQTNAENDAYIYWLTVAPVRDFPVHASLGYSANHENEDRIAEREVYIGFGTGLNELAGLLNPKLRRTLDIFSFYEISFHFRVQ